MTYLRDADDDTGHVVYRCYDAEGTLLYVGCTRDLDYRMTLQNPIVMRHLALVTTEDFPNRAEARQAERAAIAAEAAGVKPVTIGRAIASGALRAKRTGKNGGGNHLIRVADLEAWLDSLEDA